MTVRTRFAPSPTGYLHVGGARTALFNWLFARHHGGTFVLRVEDTDEARNTEEARQAIFDGMAWLGLDWDEGPEKSGNHGPYYQSQRKEIYDAWFEKLAATGRLYQDDGAWRFRFDRKPITMNDLVCGEDHLMNTPKHLQLIEAFGGKAPQYAHIPLILNPDGSKMSKSDKGAAVGDTPESLGYERQGFVSSAVVNFIALLGWNPKTDREIFTLAELVEAFSLENVNRSPGRFDLEKCKWVNQQHLLNVGLEDFAAAARPFVEAAGLPIPETYSAVIAAVKDKVRLFGDVPAAVDFLLKDDFENDEEAVTKVRGNAAAGGLLVSLATAFEAIPDWSADAAKAALSETATAAGAKPGQLMFPLRVALSGRAHGPDLGDVLNLLGKDRCVKRVRDFAATL